MSNKFFEIKFLKLNNNFFYMHIDKEVEPHMYLHIHLRKRYIKQHSIFSNRVGMEISKNRREDILSICFISIIIVLMLVIQITGAI